MQNDNHLIFKVLQYVSVDFSSKIGLKYEETQINAIFTIFQAYIHSDLNLRIPFGNTNFVLHFGCLKLANFQIKIIKNRSNRANRPNYN